MPFNTPGMYRAYITSLANGENLVGETAIYEDETKEQ